jgi:integrase
MNDLISLQNKALEAIKKFQEIESFQDLELWLLNGRGLSDNTYQTYLEAVKQFYTYFDGLHPLQWTPAHIEKYYDHVRQKNGISTAYTRMAGLKKICSNIKEQMPFWDSPFDIMSEETRRKINTTEQGEQKKPLFQKELLEVFTYLEENNSLKNLQTLAIIRVLIDTAIRAQEVCDLNFQSLEYDHDEGNWYVQGIGKGNKRFRENITQTTYEAVIEQFRARMHRLPRYGDALFYSLENYPGKDPARMKKGTLWVRLRELGDILKSQGKIRRDIQFSAHLFKRTSLTLAGKNGASISRVQRLGHHSNIQTTMTHYWNDEENIIDIKNKIQGVA